MLSCRFYLCCVVTVLCINSCIGSYHTNKCAETDKEALLKLKSGFLYGRHLLSSWTGDDCCEWKGISCNNLTGRVTKLDLRFSNFTPVIGPEEYDLPDATILNTVYSVSDALGGKIDSSICELQHLTFLDLSYHYLKGEIPKCIGSLGQLIELKLGLNELDGFVPNTFANLSNLQNLDLRYNNLVVNDLEWLSHLSNLKYLGLSETNLSRAVEWPSSISKIPYLVELELVSCGLPQVTAKSISHMNSSTALQILRLTGNELNSSILSWVVNVSKVLGVLDLSWNEIDGSIIKSFHTLCQLKSLDLSFNKLSDQPSDYIQELVYARNLKWLSLRNNPFISGPFPDFSRFSSLKELILKSTNIVGPLSFDHFPRLEYLDLSRNGLNGSLPVLKVSKFVSLEYLDLSHNQLSGTLPTTLGQFSNLQSLDLSWNKFSGIIVEAHLSSLLKLAVLSLSRNSFSFNLNPSWVPPFQLRFFDASSCILGPQFPIWLKYQPTLVALDVSNTSIIDSFPEWFWNISSSLLYLNVSHNKLSGVLPKSLSLSLSSQYEDLTSAWDFSFNNLSGAVPQFSSTTIFVLLLSNNMFSRFVSSFCATLPKNLSILDLSSNLLVGPLPNCWEKSQSLEVLSFANNSLSGRIPKSIGTLQQIKSMNFNNNNFSGQIPSLTRCKSLQFIDFGDNNLEGTLSKWIGYNQLGLIVFQLRGNRIQGSIPTSLCNLLSLQVLDLSSNNITGEIPQCLGHINALSNKEFGTTISSYTFIFTTWKSVELISSDIDETKLVWKGDKREYGGNLLGLMTFIDLSGNQLIGEIPESLTKLVALAGLNLSGNNLTGFIPYNIGHMQMLESLDLSRNHLYGRMPSSFSYLSFLSYMNLSFNNLSGEIPISTQLQTFDASAYVGNIGLCGPPLTNQCPGGVVPPIPRVDKNDTDEDDDKFINIGHYISFGLGFCVGFWSVFGALHFKNYWRHTYFQLLNNINDRIYVTIVVFLTTIKRRFQIQEKRINHSEECGEL
ncbi:hypothetical protein Fmac_016585 [Flemingia macrophylla]|uniref:Uncharacterized protein n=1 Tax=Flemingia macrophylla TaxID=520843 RepID=A0ABD1MII2_9FABA